MCRDSLLKIHGPSARSMSPGPRQDLQNPCLAIHHKIRGSESSARSMSPDPLIITRPKFSYPCLSIHVFGSIYKHPYLWALCKIHVSGYIRRSMPQRPRIHVSASMPQHPYLWMLYARSMSLESTSATPLEDPCARAHVSASIHDRMNQINRHGATARAIAQTGDATKLSSNQTCTSASQYEIAKKQSSNHA